MNNTVITYLVAACAGVFSLAAFVAWVLVPAWSGYERRRERAAATFLCLYVLVTLVALGMVAGVAAVLLWDRLGG